MSFSIAKVIVSEPTKHIVALNWAYTTNDGKLANQFKLPEPYGDVPLEECTEEMMISWLTGENGLPNTTEEFDEYLAAKKEKEQLEETFADYEAHPSAAPTKIVPPEPELEPEPEPESPVTADIKKILGGRKKS